MGRDGSCILSLCSMVQSCFFNFRANCWRSGFCSGYGKPKGSNIGFDQGRASLSFSPIRENLRWESWHACVGSCAPFWTKISLWGHGRSTSKRPKSGYARPFCTILVLVDPPVHREQVGRLIADPPPLSDTSMAVRVQKYVFQADQLTHPTNPEVAPCRAPVFGLRFVVTVFPVYRVNV